MPPGPASCRPSQSSLAWTTTLPTSTCDLPALRASVHQCPGPDGLSSRDVALARLISSTAQQLGLTAGPSGVHNVVVTIDALDISTVLPFWRAALGHVDQDG